LPELGKDNLWHLGSDGLEPITMGCLLANFACELSRDLPPKALAEFLINAWEGALLRAQVDKDRAPLQLFLKVTFSKILS